MISSPPSHVSAQVKSDFIAQPDSNLKAQDLSSKELPFDRHDSEHDTDVPDEDEPEQTSIVVSDSDEETPMDCVVLCCDGSDDEGEVEPRADVQENWQQSMQRRLLRHEVHWPPPTPLTEEDILTRAGCIEVFTFLDRRRCIQTLLQRHGGGACSSIQATSPLPGVDETTPHCDYPSDWPRWRIQSFKLREAIRAAKLHGEGRSKDKDALDWPSVAPLEKVQQSMPMPMPVESFPEVAVPAAAPAVADLRRLVAQCLAAQRSSGQLPQADIRQATRRLVQRAATHHQVGKAW
eukprot:CAMPEP_0178438112 /NCGR_PEP_ID=MMETSP0689_2-20121128/35392_1 /TAXON_ID=160604 /ORGANISM="Amphidinium massartii, Strain CS-259" /LENGTH=291 /DNA_ID=CAMNT_0020060439 /DNA_START=29 /DNA_END=901 /DNA_ORIENTATION=-